MHIVEHITVDVIHMFIMYIIAIYNDNTNFRMDIFCKILNDWNLPDITAEFAINFNEF